MLDIKKIWDKNKSVLSAVALLLAVALIFWLVNSPAIVGVSAAQRQLPIYSVEREDKVIAISFDAAWGPEDTQLVLDILAQYQIRSTFFVVGDWVDRYPESVQAIAESDCEVMNHSLHHDHYASLSSDEITRDFNACNDKIEAVTGKRPTLIRCPYGEYDDHVIEAINAAGMTAIQWDVDSLDWKGLSAAEIQERVLRQVRSGSIVLFHNAAEHTPEALPGILDALLADGYRVVPVSELLLSGDTTIDHTGRQCTA